MNYFSGQGRIYLSEIDNITNTPKAFNLLGNCSQFTVAPNIRTNNVIADYINGTDNDNQDDDRTKNLSVNILLESFNMEILSRFTYSILSDLAQDNVVNLPTKLYVGRNSLGRMGISSVSIATKILGTDYVIDETFGVIEVLSTGTIVDGSTHNVSYTYKDSQEMLGASARPSDVWLRFEGVNTIDQANYSLDIYKLRLPVVDLTMISDSLTIFPLPCIGLRDVSRPSTDQLFRVVK